MLDEIRPDVVSLLVPCWLNCAVGQEILKMGYHVILEKPPGMNREEIETLKEHAEAAGVSVRCAFNRRYAPLNGKLRELLREETIYHITYQMYRYNRRDQDFFTTSIHAIDAVKWIANSNYERLELDYQELPQLGEGVTNIYMNGSMQNGARVQLTLVPVGGAIIERISVNTDKATYFVELPFWNNSDCPGRLRRMEAKCITHDISGETLVDETVMFEESGFYEENRGFFEFLRSGQQRKNDLSSGIQSVEIADYIRKRKPLYVIGEERSK